eukprot:1155602-Pelagomonas_calceolata.AAC.7
MKATDAFAHGHVMQTHGGQLMIYPPSAAAAAAGLQVEPLGGRLVVFESQIEHEVLPAHASRSSVKPSMRCCLHMQGRDLKAALLVFESLIKREVLLARART